MINKNNQSGWPRASASIQSAAKILTCKIDNLHEQVCRYLHNMHRNSLLIAESNTADGESLNEENKRSKRKKRKEVNFDYVNCFFNFINFF
jgi:hypothetical protein